MSGVRNEHHVTFQPSGIRGTVAEGKTLLRAAQDLGVFIEAACGGDKKCGKCRVTAENGCQGALSPVTPEETRLLSADELMAGYRLACCARITGSVSVTVPEESRGTKQTVLENGSLRNYRVNPAVRNYYVTMEPPSLEDSLSDRARLVAALSSQHGVGGVSVDFVTLRSLPGALRDGDWKVTATVWQGREIIRVTPGTAPDAFGVAFDIGTTTVVAFLCNLRTGEVLAQASRMNPQIVYGEDVLARIAYIMNQEDGLSILRKAILEAVDDLLSELAEQAGIVAEQIDEAVLVYNTVMHHIALGIDPSYVGRLPFVPAENAPLDVKARDFGIKINPAGNVHSLPIEAGFVGPDNVAVLIAEEPYRSGETQLIIDIGTNGELDLGNRDRLLCTSCATGPAFEGAQIRFGMRAANGAIEHVRIDPATLEPEYKVIGSDEWFPRSGETGARGICGSGIIDAIAEMFKTGIILPSGRLNMEARTARVRKGDDGKSEYVLARAEETSTGKDISVTQADVRAVQLAKAAIYTGAAYLMEKFGGGRISSVKLAGAFGSYINQESARLIGMFPDCPPENVTAVGNAAGDGAKLALLDRDKRDEAARTARRVEFVETAAEPDFQRRFMDAMTFPHAKDRFPHLENILQNIPSFGAERKREAKR
ncbi:MAG: ASKHA domain-containing protein [Synergistaceae bacterium]|jgi:uncharacterized 2Fe-2S/4Fe-4S cluster protein (DUF4445 family)|nr:ASKHA domain-containing protein [Synergistaceae bacterium]